MEDYERLRSTWEDYMMADAQEGATLNPGGRHDSITAKLGK